MPSLKSETLQRRAATFARSQGTGDRKEKRISQLRASGLSRANAKTAVTIRFGGRKE